MKRGVVKYYSLLPRNDGIRLPGYYSNRIPASPILLLILKLAQLTALK